MAENPN